MTGFYRWSILASLGLFACGAETPAETPGGAGSPPVGQAGTTPAGTGGAGGSVAAMGGNAAIGGAMTSGGLPGSSGAGTLGGGDSGGSGSGGSAPLGGSGSGGSGGGTTKMLNVSAAPGEHLHKLTGDNTVRAGLDNRVPQLMGKLIVNLGVDDGDVYDFGLKHGFHVYGAKLPVHCEIAETTQTYATKTTAFNGNCRWETFDGVDHDPTTTFDPATAVANKVKAALTELQGTYPEEDWGFYLNADGSVRWTDVGVTGYSHGATSAARWGKKVNFWRIVSRSGPRDNLCGAGANQPPQTNCPAGVISAWLDEPTVTPIENYWGFVGNGDSQYGDIIFAMERMGYVGQPTNLSGAPPFGGSHRLVFNGNHSDFLPKTFWPAMGVAWSVPQDVMDYAAAH